MISFKHHYLCFCLFGLAVTATANPEFTPAKTYPHLGLVLPQLALATAEPTSPPQAYPGIVVIEEALWREDRFDPAELWYNTQCCGRWRNSKSYHLTLGRATHIPPDFIEQRVLREQFDAWLNDNTTLLNPQEQEQLNAWVSAFSGYEVAAPQPLSLNRFALEQVLFYPTDTPNILIYAWLPRRVGNAPRHDWFCVILHAPDNSEPTILRSVFEERFINKIALPGASAKNRTIEADELSVLQRGEELPEATLNHPVRIEARKSIENYQDWWFAETENYIILSDVATEIGTALIQEIQAQLPLMHKACLQLIPALTIEPNVALIRIFQKREDYRTYVGAERAWTGAIWDPSRRELVCFLQQDGRGMMRMFRHEAFHQYLSYAYCMMPSAPWLNEGHACLFENSRTATKGNLIFEEDPELVAALLENLDAAISRLPFLLDATYTTFYQGTAPERQLNYALAFGIVYYLHKGAPLERNQPFASILADFSAAIGRGCTYQEATEHAFAEINLAKFQDGLRTFWLKNRNAAKRYDPLKP